MHLAWNENHVSAVQELLDAHDRTLGLEESAGGEQQLWHLLMSLLEFCDARGLEFDSILEHVREDSGDCRGMQP